MDKRGQKKFIRSVIEMAIAVVAGLILLNYAVDSTTNATIKEDFFAKDMAMQINAMYSVSGNAYMINKHEEFSNFYFMFSEDRVEVSSDSSLPDFLKPEFRYVRGSDPQINVNFEKPESLIIVKNADKVDVGQNIPNLIKIDCPDIDTKDSNWRNKRILIDPGQDGLDGEEEISFESEGNTITESDVTENIVSSLKALNDNFILTVDLDSTEVVSIEEKLSRAEDVEVIISLHSGSYDKDLNTAKAYVNFNSLKREESVKLGCFILNSLTEELDIDAISIVPVDAEMFSMNNGKRILQFEDKIAVLIEIGNVRSDKGKSMLATTRDIPSQIFEGLRSYYVD